MDEMLDIVDDADNVTGQAERSRVHEEGLIHRTVMFFIFDEAGRVFVNQRAMDKEFFGGAYSVALGGHVSAGQTYEQAVRREAFEEAGIKTEPHMIAKFKKRIDEESENVTVYSFTIDGLPKLDEKEIISGRFMDLDEAKVMMETKKFLPETKDLLDMLEGGVRQ